MMLGLIALFARWGVPESVRRPLAFMAGAVALCALVGGVAGLWLHFHDRGVIEHENARQEAKAAPARDAAADQRAADTIRNSGQEKVTHDAIEESGPDRAAAPSTVALGCERLRRTRALGAALPAACGRGGGGGGQAGPD